MYAPRGRCGVHSTATQFLRIATRVIEFGDYLSEFEWSIPGVEELRAVCFGVKIPYGAFSLISESMT